MSDGPSPAGVVSRPVTRPLRTVGWGLLLVFLDLRLNRLDVLPDALGWLLVVLGAGRLPWRHAGAAVAGSVRTARVAAGVAAVLSLPDLVRPTSLGVSGSAPSGTFGVVGLLAEVAALVAGVALAAAVAGLATGAGDARSAGTWRTLRAWYLGTEAAGLVVLALALLGAAAAALPLLVVVVVADLVVAVWLTYRCFRDAMQPWALPGWLPAPPAAPYGSLGA